LTPGDKLLNPAFEYASFQEDASLAFKACNPDVSSEPHYPPLIAAAGVLLLEADYITKFEF